MATTSSPLTCYAANTAYLVAWATFCVSVLGLTSSLVQTADSGQTAAASLVYSAGNPSGYQIWRFNDTLAGAYPVFIKFEFGGSSGSGLLWITIGTGSNGSGTITGIYLARTAFSWTGSGQNNVPSYGSASNNRFGIYCFADSTNGGPSFLMIERSKDATGADTSDGLILEAKMSNTWYSGYIPFARSGKGILSTIIVPAPSGLGSLANGASVGLIPILPFDLQGVVNPGNNWMAYYGPDLSTYNPISITIHGTTHTYLPLGVGYSLMNANWANSALAVLYE